MPTHSRKCDQRPRIQFQIKAAKAQSVSARQVPIKCEQGIEIQINRKIVQNKRKMGPERNKTLWQIWKLIDDTM